MVLFEAATITLGNLLICSASGFIGNRADWLGCEALRHFKNKFLPSLSEEINHDVSKNLIECLHTSLVEFFARSRMLPFDSQTSTVINQFFQRVNSRNTESVLNQETLITILQQNIGILLGGENESPKVRSFEMVSAAVLSVEQWVASIISESIPKELQEVFRYGYDQNGIMVPPWESIYRIYLAEKIKTNERFRSILNTESLSKILISLDSLDETLRKLSECIAPTCWDDFILSRSKPDLVIHALNPGSLQHSRIKVKNEVKIKSGQDYKIYLRESVKGTMLLLERYEGRWQFLPLELKADQTTSLTLDSSSEEIILPIGSSYCSEQVGAHKLALLIFPERPNQTIYLALQSHEEYISPESQKTIMSFLHTVDVKISTSKFVVEY